MAQVFNVLLSDFALEIKGMSSADFLSAYPAPFLVIERSKSMTDTTGHHTLREILDPKALPDAKSSDADTQPVRNIALKEGRKFVWTVEKSGRNAFPGQVTIGRSVNNDIIINANAVSKYHAFISHDAARNEHLIRDMDSTNGTIIDGRRIEPDTPVYLKSGDSVSFGHAVAATFFLPHEFFDFAGIVRRMGDSPPPRGS
jgi:hypothetical protein